MCNRKTLLSPKTQIMLLCIKHCFVAINWLDIFILRWLSLKPSLTKLPWLLVNTGNAWASSKHQIQGRLWPVILNNKPRLIACSFDWMSSGDVCAVIVSIVLLLMSVLSDCRIQWLSSGFDSVCLRFKHLRAKLLLCFYHYCLTQSSAVRFCHCSDQKPQRTGQLCIV